MSFEEWLQSRLTAHGFPVTIDGAVGTLTIAALEAFQKSKNLPVTGKADDATVIALRTSATEFTERMPERDVEEPEPAPPSATAAPAAPKPVWPRQKDCMTFYGPVGTNQGTLQLPFPMRIAWDKSKTVKKITLHKKVIDSAGRVFAKIASDYSPAERARLGLDLFGGSLNVRRMRGGSNYSMHSWGIAIDFDPERNQLKWGKDRASLAHPDCEQFWRAWENEGWISLGRLKNFDWMHVQAARL